MGCWGLGFDQGSSMATGAFRLSAPLKKEEEVFGRFLLAIDIRGWLLNPKP